MKNKELSPDIECMTPEYIIINKSTIQKRIEELENKIIPNPRYDEEIDNYNILFIAKLVELNDILSQSTPLIPEIEKSIQFDMKAIQENIAVNNRLIAEFMGHKYKNQSKFHSSWDWLFPVLEKITEINYRWEIGMSSPYFYCKILPVGKLERLTPIEATYDMIIEFLLWFNKQ